jgi:hypothetical protein
MEQRSSGIPKAAYEYAAIERMVKVAKQYDQVTEAVWNFAKAVQKGYEIEEATSEALRIRGLKEKCSKCGTRLDKGYSFSQNKDGNETRICIECNDREMLDAWKATGELSTGLVTHCLIQKVRLESCPEKWDDTPFRKICDQVEEIQGALDRWGKNHWKDVREKYVGSKSRGHSGRRGGLKALVWGCAGRLMVTLEDTKPVGKGKYNGAYVSIIGCDEGNSSVGLQGIAATKEEALVLLRDATENWPEIKPDQKVRLIGL